MQDVHCGMRCGHTKQTGSQSDSNSSVLYLALYRIFSRENMQIKNNPQKVIIEKQDDPVAETSAKCHWRPE